MARYLKQSADPAFRPLDAELERIVRVAWDAYANHRKAANRAGLLAAAGMGLEQPRKK